MLRNESPRKFHSEIYPRLWTGEIMRNEKVRIHDEKRQLKRPQEAPLGVINTDLSDYTPFVDERSTIRYIRQISHLKRTRGASQILTRF